MVLGVELERPRKLRRSLSVRAGEKRERESCVVRDPDSFFFFNFFIISMNPRSYFQNFVNELQHVKITDFGANLDTTIS